MPVENNKLQIFMIITCFFSQTICGISSSNNGDKRNSQNKGRNSSTIPVVIVNNEEGNAQRNIVKTKVQVGLSEDAASKNPLQGNMCTDGNKIANPKKGKQSLQYFFSKI